GMVALQVALQCHHQAYRFLLADLETAANSLVWWTFQHPVIQVTRPPGPCLREDVHVLLLERNRLHNRGATGQNPRCLRTLQSFAATEDHHVGAFGHESPQVLGRWKRCRGIHDDRYVALVRDAADLFQAYDSEGFDDRPEHRGRVVGNRFGDLPRP